MSGRAGRTTAVYFASQVGSSVAGFLATWVIANQLGSTVLGEYSVVVAMLFWLNVPASAVGTAMNKRISEEGALREYVTAGHALNLAISAVVGVGLLAFSGQVNALANGRSVAVLLVLLVAAQGAFDLVVETLRGSKFVGRSGLLKTLERVLRSGFQIVVVLLSASFLWLVVSHTLALVLSAAVGALYVRRLPGRPGSRHLRRLVEYARYSWLGTMKTRAFAWMDTLVLGAFAAYALFGNAGVTHSQIGIYEAAWSVASVLGLAGVSIRQTLFPELSDLSASDEYERVRHFVNEGLAFTGVFVIPGLFGATVVGGDLLAVYRPEFARGKWILVMLVGARLLSAYSQQFVSAINAVDRPDVAFRINLAFLGTNLVANIVLVALFGWYGAAAATVLSTALALLAGGYLLSKLVGRIALPVREVGYQVAAALVMFGVVFGLRSVVPGGVATAFAIVAVGATIYGALLLGLSRRLRRKAVALAPLRFGVVRVRLARASRWQRL